jgi:hypothetical protein
MNRYRCTTTIVLALLVGAWVGAGRAGGGGGGAGGAPAAAAPPTQEELMAAAAARQKDLRDKQMTGLAACVVAVFVVAGVSWWLNIHNKTRKRETLLQRQQARQEADLQKQVLQECDLPTLPVPSEPPAGDW